MRCDRQASQTKRSFSLIANIPLAYVADFFLESFALFSRNFLQNPSSFRFDAIFFFFFFTLDRIDFSTAESDWHPQVYDVPNGSLIFILSGFGHSR